MRKLPCIASVLGSLLIVAGCGGDRGAASPLDNALRYLPADAPFAVSIETDTDGQQLESAGDLLDRFPAGEGIKQLAEGALKDRVGNLEGIEEVLGNELVVGSTDARTLIEAPSGKDTPFVGAIEVTDRDALDGLIAEQKPKEDGEAGGAKLYEDDSGDSFATDGDVLLIANSKRALEEALETRDGDDSLTEEAFEAGIGSVPDDSPIRVYLDVQALLAASPDAKDALRSEWVEAVRTAGLALAFSEGAIGIDFDVLTDSADLTDDDLPIPAGVASPQVLDRPRGINVALRDPARMLEFALATMGAVDPDRFRSFEAARKQIERQLEIDLRDDLVGQLDGDLAVNIRPDGKFGARAELSDPVAFKATLKKLEPVLETLAEDASSDISPGVGPEAGEDLYAVATSGGDKVFFGVVDGFLVVSNSPRIVTGLATADTRAVPGAEGALALSGDASQLARMALDQSDKAPFDLDGLDLGEQIPSFGLAELLRGNAALTDPLDNLVGSVEATTEGLSGSFELTVEPRGDDEGGDGN